MIELSFPNRDGRRDFFYNHLGHAMTTIGTNIEQQRQAAHSWKFWTVLGTFGLAGLVVVSRHNYLLFHCLAELFSISVAWAVFFLVWNTREMMENDALVFVGTSYFFIGSIDLLHTLAYKGMGVFDAHWGANLPTQLWILARYLESGSLLLYPMLIGKTFRAARVFFGWLAITAAVLVSIFYLPVFPDCYIEGTGLTPFKIASEYIVCLLLCLAFVLLYVKRDHVDTTVFRLISASVATTICGELAFTFYVSVYGLSNLVGHFFKIVSFILIYQALIRTGLTRPYSVLFKTVKESEEKYQAIFQNARVGLFRSSVSDGKPIEANALCAELAGYESADECLKQYDASENHLLKQAYGEMLPELEKTGMVKNREIRIRRDDGATLWLGLSGTLGEDRKTLEGAVVDISERKLQERSRESLLKLVDFAAKLDARQLLQKVLDEAEKLTDSETGFFHLVDSDQETITLQAWSAKSPKYMPGTESEGRLYPISQAKVWTECVGTGKPVIQNDNSRVSRKKGLPEEHALAIRELLVPVVRSGKVKAIIGVGDKPVPYGDDDEKTVRRLADTAWEIVERKRAEERLQAANDSLEREVRQRTRELEKVAHEFESLFDSSQVGMMVLRGGRFFSKGNQRLADILGYETPEEMEGLSMKSLHLGEERFREFGEKYYDKLNQGEILHVEYQLRRKDGAPVWCSLSGKALDTGEPVDPDKGVLWIVDDIGDRKHAEHVLKATLDQLERSNDELARFAYVASHDLQEPLRAIIGFLQLLESRYHEQLDEKGRHYIERTVKAGHRMQRLISDLLALSRINTRGQGFETTDFNGIVDKVVDRLQPRIEQKGAKVCRGDLPSAMADASQMETLFFHLISNALKYNESHAPWVEIDWIKKESQYRFHVKDNGIGISPRFYDRIFVVFQRLHGRREYSGTGVGLTLCKKIVERHGGRIWVESEAGKGSTFFFTLPSKRRTG